MATSLCYVCKNAVYNQTNSWISVNAQHMFHIKCLKEVLHGRLHRLCELA